MTTEALKRAQEIEKEKAAINKNVASLHVLKDSPRRKCVTDYTGEAVYLHEDIFNDLYERMLGRFDSKKRYLEAEMREL